MFGKKKAVTSFEEMDELAAQSDYPAIFEAENKYTGKPAGKVVEREDGYFNWEVYRQDGRNVARGVQPTASDAGRAIDNNTRLRR